MPDSVMSVEDSLSLVLYENTVVMLQLLCLHHVMLESVLFNQGHHNMNNLNYEMQCIPCF